MKTCCIIGHRDFKKNKELELNVKGIIINLIEEESVTKFLFGSKSKFIDFCYDIVSEIRKKHNNLSRVFVRAEYPIISEEYYDYLKSFYEDSYFYSEKLIANKYSYIKRNQTMIDQSDICLFCFDNNYFPKTRTCSGTGLAYKYAIKKGKRILNVLTL